MIPVSLVDSVVTRVLDFGFAVKYKQLKRSLKMFVLLTKELLSLIHCSKNKKNCCCPFVVAAAIRKRTSFGAFTLGKLNDLVRDNVRKVYDMKQERDIKWISYIWNKEVREVRLSSCLGISIRLRERGGNASGYTVYVDGYMEGVVDHGC